MTERDFQIQDGQTVVFIGDSITDGGRRDRACPYGDGYVRMAINLMAARYPQRQITFHNKGISGDTCPGLRDRWSDDVIELDPDWVSVLIGINDVHRRFRPNAAEHIGVDMYRQAYENILARTAEQTSARIVLMDPFYISVEADPASVRKTVLDDLVQFVGVVREMADTYDTLHVPLHDIFQQQLTCRCADTFCPEPVHPNAVGHTVIAHAWLQAVGW